MKEAKDPSIPSDKSKASSELKAALKQYAAPWQYELSDRLSDGSDCLAISDANGSSIAEMICPSDVEEPLARLIAAAPALYEALMSTRQILAEFEEIAPLSVQVKAIDAALAMVNEPANT